MFDVSFTEMMVIGVVALVVIGPERLPRVARTAGHLLGRLQRYVSTVKADINREMHIEDIKKFEQSIKSEVNSIGSSVQQEIREIETAAERVADSTISGNEEPTGRATAAATASSSEAARPESRSFVDTGNGALPPATELPSR